MPDGTINLGAYGRLVVAGRTVDQIESDVKAFIDAQEKSNETFSVRVVSRVSKVFYVLGEVNAAGVVPAGRPRDGAGRDPDRRRRHQPGGAAQASSSAGPRRPRVVAWYLPVCYREIVQLGDTSTNYQIMPGDRIYIPSRTFCEEMFHKDKDCAPAAVRRRPAAWSPTARRRARATRPGCAGAGLSG